MTKKPSRVRILMMPYQDDDDKDPTGYAGPATVHVRKKHHISDIWINRVHQLPTGSWPGLWPADGEACSHPATSSISPSAQPPTTPSLASQAAASCAAWHEASTICPTPFQARAFDTRRLPDGRPEPNLALAPAPSSLSGFALRAELGILARTDGGDRQCSLCPKPIDQLRDFVRGATRVGLDAQSQRRPDVPRAMSTGVAIREVPLDAISPDICSRTHPG